MYFRHVGHCGESFIVFHALGGWQLPDLRFVQHGSVPLRGVCFEIPLPSFTVAAGRDGGMVHLLQGAGSRWSEGVGPTLKIGWIALLGVVGILALAASAAFADLQDNIRENDRVVVPMELDPRVAQCIREKKAWSECYNMLPSVVSNAERPVGQGFEGFHEGIYKEDSGIRSIWVPTPAELGMHFPAEQS